MAQPPEKPSLDDEHRLLDFGFVSRTPRPRRQNGGVVMRRHVGIGAIDQRVIETGLDDRGLGVVRHQKVRRATDRPEGLHMGINPIDERLRPGRSRIGKARRAEHGDEDLRLADFSGQPVDDDRHAVARIIDEKPFAGRMGLPHRDRQPGFEGAIEFAKPGIAVTAWVLGDIFVPDDQQRDVLALQLPMNHRPIGFGVAPMALFGSPIGVERRL
jgi:hypothetical protein